MTEKTPSIKQDDRRYERLLRGEISSKQYVKSLKSETRASRSQSANTSPSRAKAS